MKIFTDSQAKQQFADLLHVAELEDVIIKREDGAFFILSAKKQLSPFDIDGINFSFPSSAWECLSSSSA